MKTDAFGNPLELGDRVVFMGTAGRSSKPELFVGKIVKFTPKGVNVEYGVKTWKSVPEGTRGAVLFKPSYGDPWWRLDYIKQEVINRAQSDIVKEVPREA